MHSARRQSGMTMVVSLIMLTLVTIIVVAATFLSISNVRAVGNMQFRDEAVAAANLAIDETISDPEFGKLAIPTTPPDPLTVDLNNDTTPEFSVAVTPACLKASIASSAPPSSLSLPASMTASPTWNTLWDIEATATDGKTGAEVRIHSGVRVLLQDAEKSVSCP